MKRLMKKLLTLCTVIATLVCILPTGLVLAEEAASWWDVLEYPKEAAGYEGYTPVAVGTPADLKSMVTGSASSASYYYLTQDIRITDDTWKPLGGDNTLGFYGVLDGQGHTITFAGSDGSGVTMTSDKNTGIFTAINGEAVIKNLTLEGQIRSAYYSTGTLVGHMRNGRIDRCVNRASVTVTIGNVNGFTYAGGLAGRIESGAIINCMNYGTITGDGAFVGGLVGQASYGTAMTGSDAIMALIANCANFGAVTGYQKTGGIVGLGVGGVNGTFRTQNCYNVGTVTSGTANLCGAIVCNAWANSLDNRLCYALDSSCATSVDKNYGTTYMTTADMTESTFTVTLNSNIEKGCLTYYTQADNEADSTVVMPAVTWVAHENAYPTIMTLAEETALNVEVPEGYTGIPISTAEELKLIVTGSEAKGRYYYLTNDITIADATWTALGNGDAIAFCDVLDGLGYTLTFAGPDGEGVVITNQNNSGNNAGLFHTLNNGGVIKNVIVDGAVTTERPSTGTLAGNVKDGMIDRCVNRASVTVTLGSANTNLYIGGLVGRVETGVVANCMNYGTVIGDGAFVGGLIGQASYGTAMTGSDAVKAFIVNCANFGAVTGGQKVGGIVGLGVGGVNGTFRTENCYNVGVIQVSETLYSSWCGAIACNAWAKDLDNRLCYALDSSCAVTADKNYGTTYMTAEAMQATSFADTLNGNIPEEGFSYYTEADAPEALIYVQGVAWQQTEGSYPTLPTLAEERLSETEKRKAALRALAVTLAELEEQNGVVYDETSAAAWEEARQEALALVDSETATNAALADALQSLQTVKTSLTIIGHTVLTFDGFNNRTVKNGYNNNPKTFYVDWANGDTATKQVDLTKYDRNKLELRLNLTLETTADDQTSTEETVTLINDSLYLGSKRTPKESGSGFDQGIAQATLADMLLNWGENNITIPFTNIQSHPNWAVDWTTIQDMRWQFHIDDLPESQSEYYVVKIRNARIVDTRAEENLGAVHVVGNGAIDITGGLTYGRDDTLTAVTADADSRFVGWNVNGTFVTSPTIVRPVSRSETVTAYFVKNNEVAIVFYGKYNKVIDVAVVGTAAELQTAFEDLSVPDLQGYTYVKMLDSDPEALIGAGLETGWQTITIPYTVAANPMTYAVTVKNAMGDGQEEVRENLIFDSKVTVTATVPQGKRLSHWILDGLNVGYGASTYTFFVSGSNTIEAVFVDEDAAVETPVPAVMIQQTMVTAEPAGKYTLSMIAQTCVPDGYDVLDYGMYFAPTQERMEAVCGDNPNHYVLGVDYLKVVSSSRTPNRQYMIHLRKVTEGKTRYGMAYLVVRKTGTTDVTVCYSAIRSVEASIA